MRIATFDHDRLGVVMDGGVVDVSDAVEPSSGSSRMRRLAANHRTLLPRVRALAVSGRPRPLAEVRLRAPLPDPGKIVAAPVNYRDHREEMKLKGDISALGFFLKSPTSVIGPGGEVRLPFVDRRTDHEAEFALVIGSVARNVTIEAALDYVFGYTGLIDVTLRGDEERSMRKSFDTFTPMGPWLVTPDELGNPSDVDFTLRANGEVRQKGNTGDLIWGVARFISYVSSVTTLLPGDVISTGTPAGVSPIADGDTVTLDVARVGRLTISVRACDPFPAGVARADR